MGPRIYTNMYKYIYYCIRHDIIQISDGEVLITCDLDLVFIDNIIASKILLRKNCINVVVADFKCAKTSILKKITG